MKIGHRFSFFIFQLAEKMNDPKIHAFTSVQLGINQRGKKKDDRKTEQQDFKKLGKGRAEIFLNIKRYKSQSERNVPKFTHLFSF